MRRLDRVACLVLLAAPAACIHHTAGNVVMNASVQHLSPDGLHKNPAFSQVVVTRGPVRTVRVGGQNAVDAAGQIVGKGDIHAQARQVARNLKAALEAGGASPGHVVQWNVYIVQGHSPRGVFEAFQSAFGTWPDPPLVTVLFVAGLAHPDFLLEVNAVAVVPEGQDLPA